MCSSDLRKLVPRPTGREAQKIKKKLWRSFLLAASKVGKRRKPGTVTGTMQRCVAGGSDIRTLHTTPGSQRHQRKMVYADH